MVPKFRCNRCMANFPDDAGLVAHQRALEPCNWHEWEPLDGCTEEQKSKIRKGDKVCFVYCLSVEFVSPETTTDQGSMRNNTGRRGEPLEPNVPHLVS